MTDDRESASAALREWERRADNARGCNGLTTPEADAEWSLWDDLWWLRGRQRLASSASWSCWQ